LQDSEWLPNDKALALSLQNFLRNDAGEGAPRHGPASTGLDKLLSRNAKQEINQVSVQIGIAILIAGEELWIVAWQGLQYG
jgi:hypothetical protein